MLGLAKLFAKSTSASVVSIICVLINAKVFATIIGPAGAGFLGQVLMITSTVTCLSILFGSTALIQGASKCSTGEKSIFLINVRNLWLLCWAAFNFIGVISAGLIATFMFAESSSAKIWVTVIAIMASFLSVITTFGTSIQYSDGRIGKVALQSIITGVSSVLLSFPAALLVKDGNIVAGVFLLLISQVVSMSMVVRYINQHYPELLAFRKKWLVDRNILKNYFKMTGASFVATALNLAFFLYIRHLITHDEGIASLGVFDFSYKISMQYVGLVLSGFASYYIPSFAKLQDDNARQKMTSNMLDFVLYLSIPMIVAAITFKSTAISILATSEYNSGLVMISWMMIGDFFKIISWQFSGTAIALGDSKAILVLESLWYVPMLFGLLYWGGGGVGAWFGICFLLSYLLNLIAGIAYAYKKFHYRLQLRQILVMSLGASLICVASVLTWQQNYLCTNAIILCAVVVVVFLFLVIRYHKQNNQLC